MRYDFFFGLPWDNVVNISPLFFFQETIGSWTIEDSSICNDFAAEDTCVQNLQIATDLWKPPLTISIEAVPHPTDEKINEIGFNVVCSSSTNKELVWTVKKCLRQFVHLHNCFGVDIQS